MEVTQDLAVRCEGLKKYFGVLHAVDGLDLTLHQGEILCLLGPSGCGKTTVLRLIAGLERLDGGVIRMGDRVLSTAQTVVPPEARNIGIVFQDYALFPHMTVAKNVGYGLRKTDDVRARVEEVLRLVGLDGLGSRMPHELSGGQQQRVALARALAPRPQVILFDEPFSNLDAGLRARLRTEIRRILKEARASALFVTHDQEEALSVADRVAVVWKGKVLQSASPREIYLYPVTREVAGLVGEANFLPGEMKNGQIICELGILDPEPSAPAETVTPVTPGGPVEIMIRPEHLELCSGEKGQAEVVAGEYYGHHQLVRLRLPSGTLLSIWERPDRVYEPGRRVDIRVKGTPMIYPQ